MKYLIAIAALAAALSCSAGAQTKEKIYDESVDRMVQIDNAVAKAKSEGKFVVCQLGGNWCPWCIKFAKFITADSEISKLIQDNFIYIHVNYNPRQDSTPEAKAASAKVLKRLGNAGRFGYPVMVVLNGDGQVIHIQDSALLEEGDGYNKEKVIRFFSNWTPSAVL